MNYTAMPQKKPMIRDCTERKRNKEVLSSSEKHLHASQVRETELAREEIRSLKESNAKLREFTAVVSHDLREPLRTIFAYAQLLNERYRGKLDADADEFLTFITGSAHWMAQLISDLRSDSERVTRHTDLFCVDSQKLCDAAIRNLSSSIAEAQARIKCGPLPKVLANDRLTLVFQNVIGNAIKYRAEQNRKLKSQSSETKAHTGAFRCR